MKLACVTVCVNYSDFLAWTLPINKQFFDYMVVVTTPEDKKTQKLCEFWNVHCLQTDRFHENGEKFNKGKGINEGLKLLNKQGDFWIVHMDCDIVLPPLFRQILDSTELDTNSVYHIDRMMCRSFEDWLAFYTQPILQHEANVYVHPRPFDLGVRIAKTDWQGWVGIGYFQMWHQPTKKLFYPENHSNAGRSDLTFITDNFTRKHRQMLPEIIGIHLETELPGQKEMGANWWGRKTPLFGENVLARHRRGKHYYVRLLIGRLKQLWHWIKKILHIHHHPKPPPPPPPPYCEE